MPTQEVLRPVRLLSPRQAPIDLLHQVTLNADTGVLRASLPVGVLEVEVGAEEPYPFTISETAEEADAAYRLQATFPTAAPYYIKVRAPAPTDEWEPPSVHPLNLGINSFVGQSPQDLKTLLPEGNFDTLGRGKYIIDKVEGTTRKMLAATVRIDHVPVAIKTWPVQIMGNSTSFQT